MHTCNLGGKRLSGLVTGIVQRGSAVRMTVHGSSMFPTLVDGDQTVIAKVEEEQIKKGDIVLVGGVKPMIHRVVEVDRHAGQLITKGDAYNKQDGPSSINDVVGRVVKVERPPAVKIKRFGLGLKKAANKVFRRVLS